MNVYGELLKAQLENRTADPSLASNQAGKIWFRTDLSLPKMDLGGSADQIVLAAGIQTLTNKTLTAPVLTGLLVPNIQTFASGSGTYGLSYWFSVTSASATVGATYTNNSKTFTVVATVAAGTKLLCTSTGAPTSSGTLTKSGGSGDATITFSLAQAPIYIEVEMVGGGGGGGGGAAGGAGTVGTDGGNTTFGSTIVVANGGAHGGQGTSSPGGLGGAGGSASLGTGAQGITLGGGSGTTGVPAIGTTGGPGASSAVGGGGGGGGPGAAGSAAAGNSGAGGGGGGGAGSTTVSGGGGGSGGYAKAFVVNPASTYAYAVGAAGSAGAANSSGGAGGAGAAGFIAVKEFFQ